MGNENATIVAVEAAERVNQAEDELGRCRVDAKNAAEAAQRQIAALEQEVHALRARLTAVALVIRP